MRQILVFTFTISVVTLANGQSKQLWTEYMLNWPFLNSYNIEFAFRYNTVLEKPGWRSLEFRLTPQYAFNDKFDVMAGFFAGKTYQSDVLTTGEVREMIGVRFHITPHRRILTRLLLRFEQRNLHDVESDTWGHSTRTRLRAETLTPLNKKSMFAGDQLLYLIFDGEVFFVMDQDVEERFANRFRLRAGLGYRINYGLRVEFIYSLQESKNTIGEDFSTTDTIFRLRLKQYLNKSKPSKVAGSGD